MTPSSEEIEAVRKTWPAWDDLTIRRHIQQREALSRMAEQQRAARRIHPTEPSTFGELT